MERQLVGQVFSLRNKFILIPIIKLGLLRAKTGTPHKEGDFHQIVVDNRDVAVLFVSHYIRDCLMLFDTYYCFI